MSTIAANPNQATPTPCPAVPNRKPIERYRVVHCLVPADVYRHAKQMAAASELPFKQFVAQVLQDCSAYPPNQSE